MQGQGYADYIGDEPSHRLNAIRRLRRIGVHPPGRLLDVGCAAGFFLDEARHQGWDVEGIELAPSMADHARARLGLTIHGSPFTDVELQPGNFDVITMWDYLEHSADPAGDLDRAAKLLRPDGVLVVSTGDASSLIARVCGRRWHLLTPRHHNFFFTRPSLEQAFRSAGFDVAAISYASSRYPISYLIHKLRTLWNLAVLERISRRLGPTRLGSLAIPVNLYDIMVVVGRRT